MSGLRLTVVAAALAAGLIAPAALLAEEPSRAGSTPQTTRIATADGPDSTVSVATASISTAGPGGSGEAQATSSATVSVEMGDYFYRPRDVAISAGDTVSWVNEGTVPEGHTATGDGFDSGVLEEGQTYSHTFATAGTFDYVCTLHPAMKGTVTVTDSASNGNGGGDTPGDGSTDGSTTPTPSSTGGVAGGGSSGGGSLANTGLNLILLAEIGMCLFAGGLLARKIIRA